MPEGCNLKKPVLRKMRLKLGGNNSYGNGKMHYYYISNDLFVQNLLIYA